MPKILNALRVYIDPPVLVVILLGFASGLPLALTGSTLQVWMREAGVSLGTIGLYSLIGLPYVLKFLWAPLLDHIPLPWLTRRFGRRRGWLLAAQGVLMIAIAGIGLVDPVSSPVLLAAIALVVAFASATQDIAIDAYRVERLEVSKQAAGVAGYVFAFRVAMVVSGAGSLMLVGVFEPLAVNAHGGWPFAYAVMAALMLCGMATVLIAREPALSVAAGEARPSMRAMILEPLRDFMARSHWLAILVFIALFKLGDAFAATLFGAFAIDLGFDRATYGAVSNLYGLAAVLVGGFFGGLAGRALSMVPLLWLAGLLQAVSNLAYFGLALAGPDVSALIAAVTTENLAGGFGTVVFVAFLGSLCRNPRHTATQFALLSAIAVLPRTVLTAPAGYLAQSAGWPAFFIASVVASVPALVLLAVLQKRSTAFADPVPAR